ncbi:MAG: DUF2130 domain-containing protein [Bacteroidetes bacterium]|nr:DUF2130 domain-containing protein [Bacteroidota bacterium]
MKNAVDSIECPKCGETIDVSAALAERLRRENEVELSSARKALKDAEKAIEAKKLDLEATIEAELKSRLGAERSKLKAELDKEKSEQLDALQKELADKSHKIKEFNQLKATHSQLERRVDELKGEYEAKAQQAINTEVKRVKEEATKNAREDAELKLRERDKTIDDLKNALADAKLRAEQGSMQSQGEAGELAIEEWLSTAFPLDTIEEIKKGAMGGDCVQHVNTRERMHCGMIYYESKRTKSFQPAWIGKFKEDMRQKGADIGVLVTEVMPSDMESMGQMDGVWVCSFTEFKNLATILRAMVIKLDAAVESSHNRGEKMGMLYDYMTGAEFKMTIESIVEGIGSMHQDLESEKRSMRRIWKKREKQIERVIFSTTDMYGAIQGIAGLKALPTFKALELSVGDEDGDDLE